MSQAQLHDHIEAIRKDYMQSVNQLAQQQRELTRVNEEMQQLKASHMQMQQVTEELARQNEIAQRLTRIIAEYIPHLPQQHQMQAMSELMQVEKYRTQPAMPTMEQQQAMLTQMFMQQAHQVHAAQLLGMGRGMMPGATGASPRGGKPNGVQQLPQVPQMPPGFPAQLAMMGQFGIPSLPQFAHPGMPIPGMPPGIGLAAPPALNVQVSTPSRTHSSGSRTPLSMQAQPSPREKQTPTAVVSGGVMGGGHPLTGQEAATGSPVVSPQSADSAPHSVDGNPSNGAGGLQISDSPQIKTESVKTEELSVA